MREKDGIAPDCETEKGCLIPPIMPEGQRILEIRGKLITLRGLVESGVIFQMYGATKDDIDMLAIVEEEMKKQELAGPCSDMQREKCKFEFGEWFEWACKNCKKQGSRIRGSKGSSEVHLNPGPLDP